MEANRNPYSSPDQQEVQISVVPFYLQLFWPALVLVTLSSIGLALFSINAIGIVLFIEIDRRTIVDDLKSWWNPMTVFIALWVIGNTVTLFGSIQMLRKRFYRDCVVAAVVASIPPISPAFIFSIPFGVWALLILLRKDTRAAFAEAK